MRSLRLRLQPWLRIPRLWVIPNTPDREARLGTSFAGDVTLIKREPMLSYPFSWRTTRTLELPVRAERTVTQRSVIAEVDRYWMRHSPEAVANILNFHGSVSGYGKPFTGRHDRPHQERIWTEESFRAIACKGNADARRVHNDLTSRPSRSQPGVLPVFYAAIIQRQGRIPLRGPWTRASQESQRRKIIEKITVRECLATTE